jgi:hypothetical protein
VTAVPVGAKTVRQSVRRRRFGAGIPRRATRAVPEEFAQSRHDRDLTAGSIRTQNPLPARACGFKSHLRHCINGGKEWVRDRAAPRRHLPKGSTVRRDQPKTATTPARIRSNAPGVNRPACIRIKVS